MPSLGFALFLKKEFEETGETEEEVQNALLDGKKFGKMVVLHAWTPFKDAEDALNQTNAVAAGTPTDELATWHGGLHSILDLFRRPPQSFSSLFRGEFLGDEPPEEEEVLSVARRPSFGLPVTSFRLGVYDPDLGKALAEQFPITHGQSVKAFGSSWSTKRIQKGLSGAAARLSHAFRPPGEGFE